MFNKMILNDLTQLAQLKGAPANRIPSAAKYQLVRMAGESEGMST
jgi:hypothetical protein